MTGELAHASVPDVKEAEGGLRDAGVLKAHRGQLAGRRLHPGAGGGAPAAARRARRGAGPRRAARRPDRPGDVGAARRAPRPPRRRGRPAPRALARAADRATSPAWPGVAPTPSWRAPPARRGAVRPALERIAPGIALSRGEVVLDAGTRPGRRPDPAAARGRRGRQPRRRARAHHRRPAGPRGRRAPRCRGRRPARDALVRLLASGPGLLPVWETLDEVDGIETFLPEWEQIRLLPHASAIHRFTVDRHVVETCAEAGSLIRGVRRPDLLLVAALLHDIGKGSLHDHSVAGEPLARKVVTRMGFTDLDAEVVASLVRWHLLLANLATTRDPDDPATTAELLTHVPDAASLELLRALTEADARATSTGRLDVVAGLADRPARGAGRARARRGDRPRRAGRVGARARRPCAATRPRSRSRSRPHDVGATVTVIAADRVGLLADVAGGLAALRVPVQGGAGLVAGRRRGRVGGQLLGGARRLPRRGRRARPDPARGRGRPALPRTCAAAAGRRAAADRGGAPRRLARLARAGDPHRPTVPAWSTACSPRSPGSA